MGSGSSMSHSQYPTVENGTVHSTCQSEECHVAIKSSNSGNLNNSNPNGGKSNARDKSDEADKQQSTKNNAVEYTEKENYPKPPPKETSIKQLSPLKQETSNSRNKLKDSEEKDLTQQQDAQRRFDLQLRLSCELSKPEDILAVANSDITMLEMHRAPNNQLNFSKLLQKLSNIQILDISGNQMGPASFRTLMYSMCQNTSIRILNVADNQADTDSSLSIGKMLSGNRTLTSLDVSGNHLGKDYFSRCVGPALANNNVLQVLRCASIGSTDFNVLFENLVNNSSLVELNLSSNWIENSSDFTKYLSNWLKTEICVLEHLSLKNCGLKAVDLEKITEVIKYNTKLTNFNISGNKFKDHQGLLDLLLVCICHRSLCSLNMEDMQLEKKSTWKPVGVDGVLMTSRLQYLNISNCQLNPDHLSAFSEHCVPGILSQLSELVLNNNPDLTAACLNSIHKLLTVPGEQCVLEKLSYAQNAADGVPDHLAAGLFPNLQYLNLRKSKISAGKVGSLAWMLKDDGLHTLILDGIKLSGTNGLQDLFGASAILTAGSSSMSLHALSLDGCQLTDNDLKPLCTAIAHGLPLHMLKVSGNRLTDGFLSDLVKSLKAQPGHPLVLMDLSNNKVQSDGVMKLAELLMNEKNKINLRNLNISNNNFEASALETLVTCFGNKQLVTLQASSQECRYEETDMEKIYSKLADCLGLTLKKDGNDIKPGCCSFPALPHTFHCKLLGLGGSPGDLGRMLDSAAICTDFQKVMTPRLTLQHMIELGAVLRGQGTSECIISSEEWSNVISADKDAPSWLQLSEQRQMAVYISGLPASISVQKMEGFLETEADCNVREVYLCKDVLTRKNNGFAWVLMADKDSVDRAIHCYHRGQAILLGSSFTISCIGVIVDDTASSQAQAKARQDLELRMQIRAQEDREHRSLIEESYYTSQARHAYRLAHPAYADGRIW